MNVTTNELGMRLIDMVLGHEGGYSNNPADRGGETNWGITFKTARQYGYTGAMKSMTRLQAIQIYMDLFWRGRFDKVAGMGMTGLAYDLLDFGVNSGTGRPAEALQRALNALNLTGKRWGDIEVDGSIGPQTLAALGYCRSQLTDAEKILALVVTSLRVSFVLTLAERDAKQELFMLGWLRRIMQVSEKGGAGR